MKNTLQKIQDCSIAKWLFSLVIHHRLFVIVPLHILFFGLSYYLALQLKFDWHIPPEYSTTLAGTLLVVVGIRVVVFSYFRVFRGLLRYASFHDLVSIFKAVALSSLGIAALNLLPLPRIPHGVVILDFLLVLCLVGGLRMAARFWRHSLFPLRKSKRTMIIGKVDDLRLIISYLKESSDNQCYPVVGVDENGFPGTLQVSGVPIWGSAADIPRLIRKFDIEEILFCSQSPSRTLMNFVIENCQDTEVALKIMPTFDHFLNGSPRPQFIRELNVEDLLEREPTRPDVSTIRTHLKGRKVLVTGAGGSIGSELCLQLAQFSPDMIVLLDRYESSLYSIELELQERFPSQPMRAVLGTISDPKRFSRLLQEIKVDTIFHCAAYKHVPMLEMNPVEAGYNNVLGTRLIARAACEQGIDKFIMISTDKAVNPTSVMGASKRLAELYTQALNRVGPTRFITVRFGNVLNSAGSVIPRFLEQLRSGKPLTVTDPEMERFFMTIPEACQLVLEASAMGQGGEIFVLNMGKPVKILDVARKLTRLSGMVLGKDVQVCFTGLRPGEKLYEELFDANEKPVPTPSKHIFIARGPIVELEALEKEMRIIEKLVRLRQEKQLVEKFNQIVPNCNCGKEILAIHGDDS